MTKAPRSIEAGDICRIFNDDCVDTLAKFLPANADKHRFGQGIREAARIYARDAREPTVNELHAEIAKLYRAADRRQHDQLAALVEGLSPKARNLLKKHGERLGVPLPLPEALRGEQAAEACAAIARLARTGGGYTKGRMRPTGKRSRVWRPFLYAPDPQRNFPKREAERTLVIMLQLAWLDAVGTAPSVAVHRDRPGPFAKMAAECFRLVGAAYADVAGLINSVNRHRGELKNRLSPIKNRTP
jgi:hypothetical protein